VPELDMSNPTVQELVSAMARGDMGEMSFAFEALDDPMIDGVRELREVKLWDVSVVTYPWYDGTEASLRSLEVRSTPRMLRAATRALARRAAPAGQTSWGDWSDAVWQKLYGICDDDWGCWVRDIGDGWVVWSKVSDCDDLYMTAWSVDGGAVVLGDTTEVVATYVPEGDPAAAVAVNDDPDETNETDDTAGAAEMAARGMSLTLARAYASAGTGR